MSITTLLFILGIIAVVATIAIVIVRVLQGRSRFRVDIGSPQPQARSAEDSSNNDIGFKGRINAIGIGVLAILATLLARLWSMQLLSSREYVEQAESNRLRTITTRAPRGRILDRNGTELVTNRPSLTVVAEGTVLDDEFEIQLLANVLGMPRAAVRRKLQDTVEGAQSVRTVCVDATRSVVAFIAEHSDVFPGITVEQRTQRSYPFGSLAAHVLGYTGAVTEEQLDASRNSTDNSSIQYESGDTVGQAGVEFQFESVLQGVRGERNVYVDANGAVTSSVTSLPAVSGSDVMLTIDASIQQAAEDGLQHAIEMAHQYGYVNCRKGACVVLDATNGDILAMASVPSFEPGAFIGGISNDDWDYLNSEENDYPLMNRAISGQYMSASTIKPLTAIAAINNGIATPDTPYYCTGYWTGFGGAYGQYCWEQSGHGDMNLHSGIIHSCDSVFYEIGKDFFYSDNREGMQEVYREFGLGTPTGVDLPGESEGRVPDAAWKWRYFSAYSDEDRQWKGGDCTNLAIGQGDLLVTVIQMACVYMGLGNRGTVWRPHVLKSILARDVGTVADYTPQQILKIDEPASNYDLIIAALKGVIYEESESMTEHFLSLSHEVAGKTGTGERTGEDLTGWFLAFSPVDTPKYVVAAIVEEGGFGATSAMYCVRDVLGQIYGEPDLSEVEVSDATR
ncbi:MAG: penicillin-binding protein 2 [Atopobiaceae bacterium]|nr:penicillin-binding protein 2 [Atopobiaceae bacterium]